ncbi:hypothetical protein NP493_80g01001 [Ridgeia piscesae]|uniref:TEPP protein n=1 Tax=Ridgeia piscesae TaxID=27915 RepID=A0AAD9P929_RIDPI|nr:hypothetical protein NP493_80g01001 [Ridgeia piscesae]
MTTIYSASAETQRVRPVDIPSYSYQYPSHVNTVQLAAVKEGVFHPRLPTLRRYDMDTVAQKLPSEHSRTTTSLRPAEFRNATTTLFSLPGRRLSCSGITEIGRQMHRYYTTPDELKRTRLQWSEFLNRSPERFNIRLPQISADEDLHFKGYAVRYLRPERTSNWRYTLHPYPNIDHIGRQPIPNHM